MKNLNGNLIIKYFHTDGNFHQGEWNDISAAQADEIIAMAKRSLSRGTSHTGITKALMNWTAGPGDWIADSWGTDVEPDEPKTTIGDAYQMGFRAALKGESDRYNPFSMYAEHDLREAWFFGYDEAVTTGEAIIA